MDQSEKVAYYCSELGKPRTTNNSSSESDNQQQQILNNNNNIGTGVNKYSDAAIEDQQHASKQQQQQQDGQSSNGSGDYPPRIMNRYNHQQQQQLSEQQMSGGNMTEQQQNNRKQFVQNQILTAPHQAQSSNSSASASTQPQYLISNNNPQRMTNLTPHLFNQNNHGGNNLAGGNQGNSNNDASFAPNQIHSATSYHINSNHHLYQAGVTSPATTQQNRASSFQQQQQLHHRTSSSQNADNETHAKLQNNQVIFYDGNKQHLPTNEHQDLRGRQMAAHQSQGEQSTSGDSLTTSQSMTHNDFNRLRRKSDHLGLTSEVGLENLNLDFERMLMNDGPNSNNNNNQIPQHQQQQQPRPNSSQNIDKMMRTLVNQQHEKPNNGGSDMSSTGYGRPGLQQAMVCPSKDSLFVVGNQSEDNIYEEIDFKTMNRLQSEYQIDTMSLHSDTWKKKNAKKFFSASFTRWLSTRKKSSNSQNSDQDENPYVDSKLIKRPRLISLPEPIPDNLTPEKLKRRLIVSSIVDSENSYTNSLYRLIYEYKKPLEEADPPILSANKIGIIFYCLDQILQFHRLFGLALSHHVQEWDEKEMIGSVFTTSFSQPVVFDVYSWFINNFTNAMETARRASKSKAFAQFLHDKSVSSPDRLSFFGSMVKPVQRFPQFILLLSDLLKHTPFNHPDRMLLQRALTELESLADRLNERKRDAERHFAVKQLLKDHLNESNAHTQRFLLRQDDTCLLDMDPSTNNILKSKRRKMYLLNDMLICVSTPSNRLKFAVPLSDITIIESITSAISNLSAQANFRNLGSDPNVPASPQNYSIERMECERKSLLHDLELMTSIAALVAALRFQYNGLNPLMPEQICLGIREEIRKKEFQMTLIDRSCLQLKLHSKNNKDTLVVQFSTPESKRDWLIDVRLTKLALDRANNPGWENVADNPPPAHQASLCSIGQKVPLFVKSLAIFKSDQSHLTCALHYYLRQQPFIGENPAGVLWICNVNIGASSLGALATNGAEVSLIHSYELSDSHVTCLESVGSTLWIGLKQGRIIVIDANSPSEWIQFASLDVQAEVTCIKYFGHFVYVGLINGIVAVFDAINFDKPYLIRLSQLPVTCLLPINEEIFACSHNKIWRIKETNVVDSLTVQNDNIIPLEEGPRPNLLAHCGSGIFVSLLDSPVVKLYHAETLKHLQDINVATSIRRVLNDFKEEIMVTVTSMMATRGLLWIGTNVGMIATLTLPRLQGVPLVSGSTNVALHRFLGPVNIMLNLSAGSECIPQLPFNNSQQQLRANHLNKMNEDAEAIYGQYADLMNVGDYITSGSKTSGLGEVPATSMAWEYPNVNLSGMNISDDSNSSASSGAIYQDGVPRGIKQVQNKAVVSNAANVGQATSNQQQQQQNTVATAGPSVPTVQGQMVMGPPAGQLPANQINDLSQIYDKAQSQYNQGSLNGMTSLPQTLPDEVSLERLQQLQQQQQRSMLSASQTHLANKMDQHNNAQGDYAGSQSGKAPNKLYDQPAQLIHQQQIMQQTGQATTQVDGNMWNGMQAGSNSNYGTLGSGKSKSFLSNKTVLVLAGGNGYQRMALGDNKPFSEHAHCIIWEYKS